jgi:hypothetical protein
VRCVWKIVYTQPAEVHYPPRHALGAVLLAANRAPKSKLFTGKTSAAIMKTAGPLFGLMQALKAQGKNEDAALVEARFKQA